MVKKYIYRVEWSDEDELFVARCLEFPSLGAHGDEPNKALQEIMRVVQACIRDMKKHGEPVPKPLALQKYSGKLVIRMPKELHRTLARQSAEQEVSLNQLIISRLSKMKDSA